MKQRTIAQPITATGIGLHSGKKVVLAFEPLPADGGILFQRSDLPQSEPLAADAFLVQDTMMSSNLVQGDVRIGTVEHLLSAVAGMGIDNLLIRVSASEIPIMDGSAAPFVYLLAKAGVIEQDEAKQFLKIVKPIEVSVEDKWARLEPYDGFALNFEIDFDHPAFSKEHQRARLPFSTATFIEQLSRARTFGFLKDIEKLRQHNLALGGSMDNAIVLDDVGIVNEEGLRFADEFVRHKILDAIGDLFLIGYPLLAQFHAYKSGHALNNKLVRAVLSNPDTFELVTFEESVNCPVHYLPKSVASIPQGLHELT